MKKVIIILLISSLLFQIGCSSIKEIPYPIDERKSENEIKSLNSFGKKLNATIYLINSKVIEVSKLELREGRIYYQSHNFDDLGYADIEKIKSIKFYDWWRGCLGGGMFSVLFGSIIFGIFNLTRDKGSESNLSFVPIIITLLSLGYGIYALGDIEFSFVKTKSIME